MGKNTSGKRLGIIDIVIILILVLSIVGMIMRFSLVKNTPKDDDFYDLPTEKYLVSFLIRDKRFEYQNYLKKGDSFRFSATNDDFGVLADDATFENATKWYSSDGKSYMVRNEGSNDREQRFDISGSFIVEGKMNDQGLLSISGSNGSSNTISVFSPVGLRSDLMLMTVTVTSITPYSSAE